MSMYICAPYIPRASSVVWALGGAGTGGGGGRAGEQQQSGGGGGQGDISPMAES